MIFDAHADSTKGIKPVSHEDMNRELIDDDLLKPENLLIIGLRKTWENEEEFLREKKIQTISAAEIREKISEQKNKVEEFLRGKGKVYLSFDIDCLDPSVAPGTGYPEPSGLTEQEALDLLEAALDSGKATGFDLVEVNPRIDSKGKTQKVALKLLRKIVSSE